MLEMSMPKRMKTDDLVKKLHQYNQLSILLTGVYTLGAIVSWFISYWIPTLIVAFLCRAFLSEPPPDWVQPTVIGVFLLLLTLEMNRSRDGLFDLGEFHNSDFDFGPSVSYMQLSGVGHGMGNLMAATHLAWIVTQVLLMAPHTTMLAIRRWRSRVVVKEEVAEAAVQLYDDLSKTKDWVQCPQGRKLELAYLDRARLLWVRREGRRIEVQTLRYEPPQNWKNLFERASVE